MLAAMLSVSSTKLSDDEKKLLEQSSPMGISLFARNIENKAQLKALVKGVKEVIGRDDVLIGIDQEGGRVRRLKEPQWQPYLAQSELDETLTKYHSQLIAQDLNELGINWNYAPVLDVAFDDTTEALKNRCFSSDEKQVAKLGKIMIDEYKKAGICPCVKHMPGHGRATNDPHLSLPILNYSLKEMEKDFYPFKTLATDCPAGMTAHIVIPSIDDKPITQSKKAIKEVIRGIIGFDGLLISDAIDMNALKGSIGERAKASVEAGCDCVCYCFGAMDGLKDVVANTPQISDIGLERFERIKNILKNKNVLDKNANTYYKFIDNTKKYDAKYDATEILHQIKEGKK